MGNKYTASFVIATSLLLASCKQSQATQPVSDTTQETLPTPVVVEVTREPESQPTIETTWIATPTKPYRISNRGVPEEFVNDTWQEVALPEIPESLQPTVTLGEFGRLQVKVRLNDYEAPDGLVIGEYSDGEWYSVPFAFTRSQESTQDALALPSYERNYRNPINEFITDTFDGQFQGMRLEVDEVSEETRLSILMIVKGGVIKFVPDAFAPPNSTSSIESDFYDASNLSVSNIADVIRTAEEHIPRGKVYFLTVFHILTDGVTEFYCHGYNADVPGFTDYCFENLGNEEREIQTLADFQSFVSGSRLNLTPEIVESGIDWWDDTLIKPISRQAQAIHITSGFGVLP